MPLVELDVQVPPFRQAGEQVALLELEATVPVQAPPFGWTVFGKRARVKQEQLLNSLTWTCS